MTLAIPHEPVPGFAELGFFAGTTTREAGSFNLMGDEPASRVVGRWMGLMEALAPCAVRLASAHQVHGDRVLEHGDAGRLASRHGGCRRTPQCCSGNGLGGVTGRLRSHLHRPSVGRRRPAAQWMEGHRRPHRASRHLPVRPTRPGRRRLAGPPRPRDLRTLLRGGCGRVRGGHRPEGGPTDPRGSP